jgi:hypothetical protein
VLDGITYIYTLKIYELLRKEKNLIFASKEVGPNAEKIKNIFMYLKQNAAQNHSIKVCSQ